MGNLRCLTRKSSFAAEQRDGSTRISCHLESVDFLLHVALPRGSGHDVDLDQTLSQKNTLSGRFFYSRATMNLPFSPNGTNRPGWGTDALNRNTMFVLADTHVFNSNLVNIARFGYMRFDGSPL